MGPELVRVWCPGRPKTKGSMRVANARTGAMAQAVVGSSRWAQLMTKALVQARRQPEPYAGPVRIVCVFAMPVDNVATGRPGDLDKLIRNVWDACTKARIWADDVQAVESAERKIGVGPAGECGVYVVVTAL